ncbi:DUF3592 domain-containing protein, partial [Nocardiopsis protaetiae]
MDDRIAVNLLLFAVIAVLLLILGARRTAAALARRRRELELAESGVLDHGTVTAVHPMDRATGRHRLTISLRDPQARTWEARDDSGTGGYLLAEGTPVTVVYSPRDPWNIRVERAAFPDRSLGDYPLHPGGGPRPTSLAAALSPFLLSLAALAVAAPAVVFGTDSALDLVPLLFLFLGLALLAWSAYSLITGRNSRPAYSASTTGVITDSWTETRQVRRDGRTRTIRSHPFTVRFRTHDGREVHVRHPSSSSSFTPAPGQPVRVDYDP